MSALIQLPHSLVAEFRQLLPELRERDCDVHPGEFTREDITKMRKRAPSLHVATPVITDPNVYEGVVAVKVQCVALLCVADGKIDGKRQEPVTMAAYMLSAIIARLPYFLLGEGIGGAENLRAKDFTIASDQRQSEAVWILTWDHKVHIDDPTDDGVLPSKFYLGIAPEVGPDHIDDYELIVEIPADGEASDA